MEDSGHFYQLKILRQWAKDIVHIIIPWASVPLGFKILASLLQGCAEDSLQDILLFVVLPMIAWMIFYRYCGPIVFGPTSAPSSVVAIMVVMAVTYISRLSIATNQIYDAIFGICSALLGFMFWRMIKSNPGRLVPDIPFASVPSNKTNLDITRAVQYGDSARRLADSKDYSEEKKCSRSKYCRYCNVSVERYDHHCPAIYNCVGRKNHVLFLALIVNFIIAEALYLGASKAYLCGDHALVEASRIVDNGSYWRNQHSSWSEVGEVSQGKPWVFGTAIFASLHILWQVPFVVFHVYCACVNLTTDELFHWESYVDLHVETPPELGRPRGGKEFFNPYCNGVKQNIASFLNLQNIRHSAA